MPYRARSSGAKRPGRMLADRSFCMPVCLPRRKLAMARDEFELTQNNAGAFTQQGSLDSSASRFAGGINDIYNFR
jgi:hypothetical protein